MFSEASVSHFVHGGGVCLQGKESVSGRGGLPPGLRGSAQAPPPVLTSSGGHCSGQYVSYWNAFFLS